MNRNSMRGALERDFGVTYTSTGENADLYAGINGVLFQLLLHIPVSGGFGYKRVYVHRHQVVSLLMKTRGDGRPECSQISREVFLMSRLTQDGIEIDVTYDSISVPFYFKGSVYEDTINSDLELVKEIMRPEGASSTVLKNLSEIEEKASKKWHDECNDLDIEVIVFEKTILRNQKEWGKKTGLFEIYDKLHLGFDNIIDDLTRFAIPTIINKPPEAYPPCVPGCICEFLRYSSERFFPDIRENENGEYDFEQVKSVLNTLLDNSTLKQRAHLLYLFTKFQSSPLISLNFRDPNFDIDAFNYKMTYDYGEGSDIDILVRTVSACASYFVKINQSQMYI